MMFCVNAAVLQVTILAHLVAKSRATNYLAEEHIPNL